MSAPQPQSSNETDLLRPLTGYQLSRDYEQLADLMRKQMVICVVDYRSGMDLKSNNDWVCRDVAHTMAHEKAGATFWQISARGITYVAEFTRERFITSCQRSNVEWIVPEAVV